MKLLIIIVPLFCFVGIKAQKINFKLLPKQEIVCNYVTDLTVRTVEHYFRDQHSLTFIDFSETPAASFFTCTNGNEFIPVLKYDEWRKVNLGEKISDGGLSGYPTTRGFFFKISYEEVLSLYPVISEFNPLTRLMINLDYGSLKQARELLEIGWKHKMLDVAVLTHFQDSDGTNVSLCMLNPFAGDKTERRPDFQCFNITKKDLPFDKIDKFAISRITNLQQYPLRIDIFEEILLSRAVKNGNGMTTHYEFADGDTVEQLAEVMNFTPIYNTPKDELNFGYQCTNGTFTGSLGAMENGEADLSANPIFIWDYNTKKSLFLQPIAMKRLFFMFQKRETFKVFIVSIISQLDYTSKVLAACMVFAFPLIYCLITEVEARIKGVERQRSSQNIVYVFALMTSNSTKVSTFWAARVVVAAILFYTLLFSSLFQGSITKSLSQNHKSGDIKTVSELLKENYTLIMERSLVPIFHDQEGNELGTQLKALSRDPSRIVETTVRGISMTLANKNVAFLLPDSSLTMLKQFYNEQTGDDLFDALPNAVFEFFVAPMSQKDCPFIVSFRFSFPVLK